MRIPGVLVLIIERPFFVRLGHVVTAKSNVGGSFLIVVRSQQLEMDKIEENHEYHHHVRYQYVYLGTLE